MNTIPSHPRLRTTLLGMLGLAALDRRAAAFKDTTTAQFRFELADRGRVPWRVRDVGHAAFADLVPGRRVSAASWSSRIRRKFLAWGWKNPSRPRRRSPSELPAHPQTRRRVWV